MKTKRLYQTPSTQCMVVELEGGFCASIVNNDGKGTTVNSNAQGYEESSALGEENGFFENDGTNINWE